MKQGTAELLACLTLVSPSGMTADERGQWVSVARQALSGIPVDLLERGCAVARRKCRFPSEIVPAILAEVEGEWERRKRRQAEREAFERNRDAPRLPQPEIVAADEVAKLIAQLAKRAA